MSLAPNFPILQDTADNSGAPWHLTAEGDAVNARNKGMVVIAKDSLGNAQIPEVDSQNRLLVNSEGADTVGLKGEGDNAGSGTFVDLFDITLQNDTQYQQLEWLVSCFREATFEILWIDDEGGTPTETILCTPKVGSGAYSNSGQLFAPFTTGSVGNQVLRVRALNQTALSQLEAAASIQEVQ